MKQFGKILRFELNNYFTNKIFVGVTVFLVAVIAVVMFFPRISQAIGGGDVPPEEKGTMLLVSNTPENADYLLQTFAQAFTAYDIELADNNIDEIKDKILTGKADCAFVMQDITAYTYYVNNLSMYDANTTVADELLKRVYQYSAMISGGMTDAQAQGVMTVSISHSTQSLGKDQVNNFFYTYIMIFALYMVILLYGQMVATSVATEKSSRAMEILITSAKPVSMMFGKVIASCIAGLLQLVAVFGTSLLCYNVNAEFWQDNMIVSSIFNMPYDLFVFMLLFFVLGFFIYAFMYGAIGSTASKLEDINTSVMPVTMLFMISFFVVMFSVASGEVDTVLMKVCSYIPFISPMAMFTRLAMSTVPVYEIIISVTILLASVVGVGVVSAKIYRVGVLLYGNKHKLKAILGAFKKA